MAIPAFIDPLRVPRHVAVIMDGNGRWAKAHGSERIFGHNQGVHAVRAVTEAAAELGIDFLTLYAFSTENWKRPQNEVNALMELLVHTIGGEMKTLMDNNVRLQTIGDTESLPDRTRNELKAAIDSTKANSGLTLVLALSYSARWEMTKAVQSIATKVAGGALASHQITEQTIGEHLATAFMPDPELLIRTSGENRVSNFLLWQIAYTELYITPVLWPDFDKDEFFKAIGDYQRRERRFGLTGEQVKA
ncbi:MAG TPA: isoprenyl transferase [Chitinophagales bacterium]|nr:isoprenyl transferase [Chitinophagales bacterium]